MNTKLAAFEKQTYIPKIYNYEIRLGEYKELFSSKDIKLGFKDISEFTPLKRISLTIEGDNYFLSPREIQCLVPKIKGKTSKEIARKLGLSPRSVEKYIDNIQYKMKCASRGQMMEKIFRCYDFHIFLFGEFFFKITQTT